MKRLSRFLCRLPKLFIGSETDFSLEHRIFHIFSFSVCLTTVLTFFVNVTLGFFESAIIGVIVCLIQGVILYISRVERKLNLAVAITGVELHLALILSYFTNSGIAGPTALLLLGVLYLMTSVAHKKRLLFWIVLNVLTVGGLYYAEYSRPDTILVSYHTRAAQYIDNLATYILILVLMSISIFYTRRAYNRQRANLEEKATALEQLNASKNKLFSIVSHDLRAPVGAVKQYLDFLRTTELSAEERQTIEDALIKSTNDAYELLDKLLIWAKGQLGGTRAHLVSLDAAVSLANLLKQVEEKANEKQISFKSSFACPRILADEHMLNLIIRNLLYNALKFSEVGGEVSLTLSVENGEALFKVTDSGMGISLENQQKIFSLDVQSTLGTHKEKGTGLGLLLCKEYAGLQNGAIWFYSEPKKGSIFYLSLPLSA
ncbi:sensor histidine kinase [Pelobium manganitolerans]|uniref:sensor histidine kinase n=1 Tax=Pelobium manganitolerans TaxID=1842495 RepID=UPI003FA38B64